MTSNRLILLIGTAALLPVATFAQTPAARPGTPAVTPPAGAAQITVQPATPQVTVQQPRPQVTVNQGQPEITVHQPAPTVTVDIPQPVITIRMPKPDVNVSMAQPQVQITQAKPDVQVNQAPQAQINVQQTSQPAQVNVSDDKVQPKVNFTSEQAMVVVNQAKGEPQVKVEQTAAANANPLVVVPVVGATGAIAPGTGPMPASRLLRMNVVNANNNTLGDVEHVMMGAGNKPYVVIGHGGFLGMGEKQVALPLANMMVRDGKLIMQGMTDDQIKAMPAWDAKNKDYNEVTGNTPVPVGAAS